MAKHCSRQARQRSTHCPDEHWVTSRSKNDQHKDEQKSCDSPGKAGAAAGSHVDLRHALHFLFEDPWFQDGHRLQIILCKDSSGRGQYMGRALLGRFCKFSGALESSRLAQWRCEEWTSCGEDIGECQNKCDPVSGCYFFCEAS